MFSLPCIYSICYLLYTRGKWTRTQKHFHSLPRPSAFHLKISNNTWLFKKKKKNTFLMGNRVESITLKRKKEIKILCIVRSGSVLWGDTQGGGQIYCRHISARCHVRQNCACHRDPYFIPQQLEPSCVIRPPPNNLVPWPPMPIPIPSPPAHPFKRAALYHQDHYLDCNSQGQLLSINVLICVWLAKTDDIQKQFCPVTTSPPGCWKCVLAETL